MAISAAKTQRDMIEFAGKVALSPPSPERELVLGLIRQFAAMQQFIATRRQYDA